MPRRIWLRLREVGLCLLHSTLEVGMVVVVVVVVVVVAGGGGGDE